MALPSKSSTAGSGFTTSGFSKTATPVNGLGLLRTPKRAATNDGRARRKASDAAHSTKEFAKMTAPLPERYSERTNSRTAGSAATSGGHHGDTSTFRNRSNTASA